MFDDLYKVGNISYCKNSCSKKNVKTFSKQKAIAISKYDYGPTNPYFDIKQKVNIINIKYDKEILYSFDKNDIFLSDEKLKESPNYIFWKTYYKERQNYMHKRCGNCAAFNFSDNLTNNETSGYCYFLKFNSLALRTCKAWSLKYFLIKNRA